MTEVPDITWKPPAVAMQANSSELRPHENLRSERHVSMMDAAPILASPLPGTAKRTIKLPDKGAVWLCRLTRLVSAKSVCAASPYWSVANDLHGLNAIRRRA